MAFPILKYFRLGAIRILAGTTLLNRPSIRGSYQLLPTSSARLALKPKVKMSFSGLARNYLVVLVLLLLLVGSVWAGVILRASSSTEYPSLLEATIETLIDGLARKRFTSVDLVKAYLARIAEVQDNFHAVTEVNPDALHIAAKLDVERSKGRVRGPLHGIPLLLKNNIATNDKMNNTAGSYALLGAKVPRDSTVVHKLRNSGAILLGKSSLSEWAYFRSRNTSDGWSAQGGQVYGPYFPEQDPWGSSSGSAVAAALGLVTGCLGTETDGSITGPASFNNVVGIKPTVGLTSRYLVIPISEHQDTVGSVARTVKDAAFILQAIIGVDAHDNYTSVIPDTSPKYVKACKMSALSGLRLGIPRNVISLESDNTTTPQTEAFEQALQIMRSAGAVIVDDTNFTAAKEFWNSDVPARVLEADFIMDLQIYLDTLVYNPKNISSLAELRNFTQSSPLEDYPARDTGVWDSSLEGWNNTDPRFWPIYNQNLYYGSEGGLLGAIERNQLDAVILPANFASKWAATVGCPIVTVPLGFYAPDAPIVRDSWGLVKSGPNIPFGISFLGKKFTEERLIGMAYAFEQRTKVRNKVQPYIVPSSELKTHDRDGS
ncbi:amidase [Bisporella sp. PMI_857]|nr:amidase [Bisporella sp. PMI_857]